MRGSRLRKWSGGGTFRCFPLPRPKSKPTTKRATRPNSIGRRPAMSSLPSQCRQRADEEGGARLRGPADGSRTRPSPTDSTIRMEGIMARHLKTGRTAEQTSADAKKVRDTVTGIIDEIEGGG